MNNFLNWLNNNHHEFLEEGKKKKWIQGAVNPAHKGFCTPLSKPTCTPKRKALAKVFKGTIRKANLKKGKNPKGPGMTSI